MINGGPINGAAVNSPYADVFVDWAALIDPLTTRTYYALDVVDGESSTRIPISSWQATIQTDRASYVQAVIPAATAWVPIIAAMSAPQIVISRGVLYEDGTTQESELARAPLQQTSYAQGPQRATLTISGYGSTLPGADAVRYLTGIRSRTVTSAGVRVRASIDWFLRPGQIAFVGDDPFTVAYINYYANADDEYMDAGERAS